MRIVVNPLRVCQISSILTRIEPEMQDLFNLDLWVGSSGASASKNTRDFLTVFFSGFCLL
jgi:hypothetical protein